MKDEGRQETGDRRQETGDRSLNSDFIPHPSHSCLLSSVFCLLSSFILFLRAYTSLFLIFLRHPDRCSASANLHLRSFPGGHSCRAAVSGTRRQRSSLRCPS